MQKTIITTTLLSLLTISGASAMEMTTGGDTMMKDKMSTSTTMMKDTMMKDTMAKDAMSTTMMDKGMMSHDMYDTISNKSPKADITKVQMMLVKEGHLVMPRGVAYGYYGRLTTAAFKKYKNATMMMKDSMQKDSMKGDTMMKDKVMQ